MKKIITIFFLVFLVIIWTVQLTYAKPVKEIKIGVIGSRTGAFATGGGLDCLRGLEMAIDMTNNTGGVLGMYKVIPVMTDDQSNPNVGISEAERLIAIQGLPIITGIYSSSIAAPVAMVCEKNKTIMWINMAVADGILKGKYYQYVFRPQHAASQYTGATADFLKDNYKKLGVSSPDKVRVALLHEDGPYGTGVASGTRAPLKKYGFNIIFDELYAHDIKDMSPIILKLKAANPDVIYNAGYLSDVCLFLKQGRQLGLKFKLLVGSGGGYSNIPVISETIGRDLIEYLLSTSGMALVELVPPEMVPAEWRKWNTEFVKTSELKYGLKPSNLAYMQSWVWSMVLLNYVLADAIAKYGLDPTDKREAQAEAIRKACRNLDIPIGGTGVLYGVKFAPPDHEMAGQNMAISPVVNQWAKGRWHMVWPERFKTADPWFPIPKDSPFAK